MSPKYTLYYFPIKAVAEPIRLLLSYGEVDFEDVRVTREEWPKQKPNMPLGQMPVLEVDGRKLVQSGAICRYLANQFGLAGSSDWENLEIDIAVDTHNDLRLKLVRVYYEPDEAIKEQQYAELTDTIKFLWSKLDDMAKKNNGHMALRKLTWADLVVTGLYDYMKIITRTPNLDSDYPNLKKVRDNVLALPQIKAWYAKAPKANWPVDF